MENDNKVALLRLPDGQEALLPILHASLGPDVVDVTRLYEQAGYFTYDPAFGSTGSCSSAISFIDGEKGILLHRGYPIEQLAEKCDFMEVTYLLTHGELPTPTQKSSFISEVKNHTLLHDQVINFYRGFRRDAHPMAVTLGVLGALSAFYHDSIDIHDPEQRALASLRLIAKLPTIAAHAYNYSMGFPLVYPCNDLDYAANFLYMMFSLPTEKYRVNPVFAKAIDRLFVLHADHEQNASTTTVRIAGSSGANPFACIAAGVASLWGPAHGGANEAVIHMLQAIGTPERIKEYIAKAKDKTDPFRLMGFGHRVYKNYDPRAKIMRETCYEVLNELGRAQDPLLELALQLEEAALEDSYFVERKLYPNVDFYSGIILRALGIPTSMYPVLFAVARTAGWVAQWNEMIADPNQRISRPRQLYTGLAQRELKR